MNQMTAFESIEFFLTYIILVIKITLEALLINFEFSKNPYPPYKCEGSKSLITTFHKRLGNVRYYSFHRSLNNRGIKT